MSFLADPARSVTRLARGLCVAPAVIGGLVLVGYATETRALLRVFPGQAPMVANTALALALLGTAGFVRCSDGVRGVPRFVALLAALFAIAIGGGTLIEYVVDVDLAIDRLIMNGRPAPMAALAVLFIGLALLVFDTRRTARARPSEWLVLAAGHTALVGMMGHIFSGPRAYPGSGPVIGVTLATALGMTALSIGLLLARCDAGLMRVVTSSGPGGIMFRRLVLPFVFAPAIIGLAVKSALGEASLHDPALLVATLFAGTSMFGVLLLPLFAAPLDRAHAALQEDITARCAAEEAAKHLEAELRKAVAARDEVLGIVAHDLRNPLSTATLTAELLVRPEHERRVQSRHLADRLGRALKRANRLIEDLLDVTRLENGSNVSVAPCPQPLDALAREAFDMLEPAATAASVALEAKVAPDLPLAWADEARIVQVLGNLIGNALKFTPRGGRVHVSATQLGDELSVTVADTGKGVAPEHLAHMFDRFWQANAADRRGAGLGLAIAKGIVEAHGGRIWAESEPGRGCRVTFTLPVATAEAPRRVHSARGVI
ncbi:MAG: HAMP domain-containing sensor histidine kinase [Kofleriaceae bacterium]|nr:HAMP domain-containing sensor histidine kinase [Kofleriaceae bacterium]